MLIIYIAMLLVFCVNMHLAKRDYEEIKKVELILVEIPYSENY